MTWLVRVLSIVALAGFSAAVWFAGPLVGFADGRPLEGAAIRLTLIAVVVLAVALYYGIRIWRRNAAQNALETAIAGSGDKNSDARLLETRMREAVATLGRNGKRRNFLYELPWYVVIGAPGAGKTTALVNSGLKFPLAGSGTAQPVAGVGGTRYCDWWFTDDAVLIDTAGRYTTHDSDPESDRKSWLGFLSVLAKYRPRQPINGVVLAISLSDLMTQSAEDFSSHVSGFRARLKEIHDVLRIEFPVYVLFTKADLIAGFSDYFGSFDEERRRKVWGTTFQAIDPTKALQRAIPAEFDALTARLSEETPDQLQSQSGPASRLAIFGFAAQFGALKRRVQDLVSGVFESGGETSPVNFRGFYFSSGTQEGTPIDQLLGSMSRHLGGDAAVHMSGKGKSYFLHDLLAKVIFAEAGWVSRDKAGERRAAALRFAAIALVSVVALGSLGALGFSFASNRALIRSTSAAVAHYREVAQPLVANPVVADSDLENVIGALDALRDVPVGYGAGDQTVAAHETMGMGQRERLASVAQTAYRQALERLFRSRLLLRMEEMVRTSMSDPPRLYESLKVYMMLGGKAPKPDDDLIVSWMREDWEQNRYPGPQNREGRQELERHLRALLELDDAHDPVYELDRQLIESAQRSLGRMTVADRAEALLVSANAGVQAKDFSVAAEAGSEAPLVFEPVDGSDLDRLRVPGLYTYDGFHKFYLSALAGIADRLDQDQWVFGGGNEQGAIDEELLRIGPELLDRYSKDFAAAWNGALDRLNFKEMSSDKPRYTALSAVASPSSPVRLLIEAVARETALMAEPMDAEQVGDDDDALAARVAGLSRLGIQLPTRKSQNRAGTAFSQSQGVAPGASIDAQFRPFQLLVAGRPGQRPVDALIQNFHDIYQSMLTSAALPVQSQRVNANLQLQISSLRANASRLPKPLARIIQAAADDFEGEAAETTIAQLNEQLQDNVTAPCEELIGNRYPFAGSGADDVGIDEFARLFAPGGIIDRFFAQNVAPLADTSGQTWQWKQGSRMGRELSQSSLKAFQLAAQIRDAFFPLGGSVPAVNVTFTPFSLNADADQALLNVNGQIVQSYQTGNTPGIVTWPGSSVAGSAQLSLIPELSGRESALNFVGPWALKRLLDAGALTRTGETMEARFVIGGRDVTYTLQMNSSVNPFSMPALSGFSCPEPF
jgi:type VI secretion system protein ImpL